MNIVTLWICLSISALGVCFGVQNTYPQYTYITSLIAVGILFVVGLMDQYQTYKNGVVYGRENLLKLKDLKLGKIYMIHFRYRMTESSNYLVYLLDVNNMDISCPDHFTTSKKGIMILHSGSRDSPMTEIDETVKNGDLVTLRCLKDSDGFYLAKWLNEKILQAIT